MTYSNPSDPSEPTEQLTLTYNAPGFRVAGGRRHGRRLDLRLRRGRPSAFGDRPGPTAAGLTTSYTYDTGSNPETTNALLSITNPDGSQQNFTYDALGRLSGTSANGGADAIDLHLPGRGRGHGHRQRRRPDHRLVQRASACRPASQDPLGGISTYVYDNNGNLVSYTDAAGDTYQYTYDHNGNLTQTVNPLGQTVQMTYNSLSDLTSITDADDNTTQYSYSSAGNLLSITYPGRHPAIVHLRSARQPERNHRAERRPGQLPVQRPGAGRPGDLRRRHLPDLQLRRPRQPADGANLRCQRHAHRHHHADLQRRQRADLDQLSRRPVARPSPTTPRASAPRASIRAATRSTTATTPWAGWPS